MKKKAVNREEEGLFERFCSAQENKARISLILAAVIVIATIGSAATAAIKCNSAATVPSENMELNVAEQYLAKVAIEASESETEAAVS